MCSILGEKPRRIRLRLHQRGLRLAPRLGGRLGKHDGRLVLRQLPLDLVALRHRPERVADALEPPLLGAQPLQSLGQARRNRALLAELVLQRLPLLRRHRVVLRGLARLLELRERPVERRVLAARLEDGLCARLEPLQDVVDAEAAEPGAEEALPDPAAVLEDRLPACAEPCVRQPEHRLELLASEAAEEALHRRFVDRRAVRIH